MKASPKILLKNPFTVTVLFGSDVVMERSFQTTPIEIGRLTENDIVLPYDFVSRQHCQISFENGKWLVTDSGSKTGLCYQGTSGLKNLELKAADSFQINRVTIRINAVVNDLDAETYAKFQEASPASTSSSSMVLAEVESELAAERSLAHKVKPLLDIDASRILLEPHGQAVYTKLRALQLTVMWHDQVLETREFAIGSRVIWEANGQSLDFGVVERDVSTLRVPSGSKFKTLVVNPSAVSRAELRGHLSVHFRYVPKSPEPPVNISFIDERLLNPLIVSSVLHGAIGVSTFLAPHSRLPQIEDEPKRFAKIITAPPVVEVAKVLPSPTPAPTPLPLPEPTPVPEVVKAEPPKPTPKPKKVVVEKKHRPKMTQVKRQEMPKPVAPKVVAQAPAPAPPPAKVEPKPQPFNAKSVGALKMLAMLSQKSSTPVTNVDQIHVSRDLASSSTAPTGKQQATGDILTQLNQSSASSNPDATETKGGKISGAYTTGGLSGKTGHRQIKGSVVGGATYTESTKNEGLTREQVMKVVGQHQSRIQQCYERSLVDNPDLVGRALFEWQIDPGGTVSQVSVKEATLKNGEHLLDCVKAIFSAMKFPKAKNGESTAPSIGLPFGRL
jgi:hypothetical protein